MDVLVLFILLAEQFVAFVQINLTALSCFVLQRKPGCHAWAGAPMGDSAALWRWKRVQRAIEQELLLNTKLSMLWEAVWVLNPRA